MSKDISEITEGLPSFEARQRILDSRIPVAKGSGKEAQVKKSLLPPIKKASELAKELLPLPKQLVEGLMHVGETMVYGGGSKTNKTFAMMDLAVSVAAGVPWWDMETTQGRVLYMDFELQRAFFKERLLKIADAKGVPWERLDSIDLWNLRGHAADLESISEEITKRVKDGGYSLIILDPIYKVLGDRDENSAGDINSLMNELDKIAVASGAGIVIGHHFSKGNQAGKESMDRISGSGVFGRSPDAIVIITKHEEEGVYTVETTLRNFKHMEPFCVEWEHPLMVRKEDLDPKKLKRAGAAVLKYTSKQVLDVLGKEALTTSEWRIKAMKTCGMSLRTFMVKRGELVDARKVVMVDGSKWKVATEVQGADDAIAPAAPPSSAVCVGAAALLS